MDGRQSRRRRAVALAALALVALLPATAIALGATAAPALGSTAPELASSRPDAPPTGRGEPAGPASDGSCDTVPESYPGNGVPVPLEATCRLVTTVEARVVAELWTWRDAEGLHWYNYASDGFESLGSPALTMCATTDASAAGAVYGCTVEHGYFVFTSASEFVTHPVDDPASVYFCERIRVYDDGGRPVEAAACGSIDGTDETVPPTEPPAGDTPPTSPPVPPPATTTPPPPADEPTSTLLPPPPPDEPGDDEPPEPNPSAPVVAPPTTSEPEATADDGPAPTQTPRRPNRPGRGDDAVTPTPDELAAVDVVTGSPFPVGLVAGLAGGLGLLGVGTLVLPRLAQRRH